MDTLSIGTNDLLSLPETSYRRLLDNTPVAIYTTDQQGYINYFNRAAADLWGRAPEIGKDLWCGSWKIYLPDGITPLPLDECPMAIMLKEKRKVPGAEIIIERPDGLRKNVLPYPEPLYDHTGEMIGAVNTLVDITDRKTSEKNQARFEAIIQSSEDAIIAKTLDGIVTSWNVSAEKMFGYSESEMLNQPIAKLIPVERLEEETYILNKIRNGERVQTFQTRRLTKNKGLIDVSLSISPIKDGNGYIIGASKIVRDITRQRELDEALRESEERLRMASESARLGTWEFHPLSKKMIWSDECKKIYGLPLDQEPSYDFTESQNHPDDRERLNEEVARAMDPGTRKDLKIEFRILKGEEKEIRWLSVNGKVFFNSEKLPERFIGTMMDITDEKRSVQLLQENEERFRMAVESTRLGTWEYNPQSGKLTWSGECRKIYDLPDDIEVDYNFFSDHIHPEDKAYAQSEIEKAMQPGGSGNYNIQYRILRHSDKQPRWIRTQGKVYFNTQHQPERFIGTVLDISDAKKREQELMDSVEMFQGMVDNVPAMIWMSGADKFNDFFNRTWLEFTGRNLQMESKEGWLNGVHPDDRQKCIDTYNNSFSKEQAFYTEYRLLRHDGQYRWIADNSVPRFSPDGEFQGFISACIDIDDQRRFREKILDSELLFKTITNASPTALWMTDRDKKNVFISDTWLKWTGSSFEDQLHRGWLSVLVEEDRVRVTEHFADCFEQQKYFVAEFRVPDGHGELRWCMTEGRPYQDINGNFAGYAGSITDITELKQMEERKDDFIKMASHELKTPITSINGYVQLLLNIYEQQDDGKLQLSKEVIKSSLGTISRQVARLTRLVSELLDLSRIESGKLELNKSEFRLEELVQEAVQEARYTTAKHAILFSSEYKGNFTGDRDRMSQVLANLLNNAIKYSKDSEKIEVWLDADKNSATIGIKDYGIGIAKKDQMKIFERFYRAEGKSEQTYPGFGIGLFIANEIIQRHQGTITVKSQKNKGALFMLTLPLVNKTNPESNGKKRSEDPRS